MFLFSSCFSVLCSVVVVCLSFVVSLFPFVFPFSSSLTYIGEREAEINLAEGKRQAVIFEAEALAKEIELKADATAYGI